MSEYDDNGDVVCQPEYGEPFERPTPQLRYLDRRTGGPMQRPGMPGHYHYRETVLQQAWLVGADVIEWRDVPTETQD